MVALGVASVRVLREYERAVVFRLGRLLGQRGPGSCCSCPGIDRMVRVSLRTVTLNIPPQNVITCDNVPAHVDAVAYFRVVDPSRSVVDIEDAVQGDVADRADDAALRARQGRPGRAAVRARAAQRGTCSTSSTSRPSRGASRSATVEIRDVGIPSTMQRAMARQAEAERERRAKVIHAEGEFQAAAKLREAADVIQQLARRPAAALPADAVGDRRRAELDDHLPAADRPHQADPGRRRDRRDRDRRRGRARRERRPAGAGQDGRAAARAGDAGGALASLARPRPR